MTRKYKMKKKYKLKKMFMCTYTGILADNIRRSLAYGRKQGRWMGPAPLGYKNIRDASGHADIIVEPGVASIIMKLFRAYATEEYTMKELTEFANSIGLKTKQDKYVSQKVVKNILTNPFYYGMAKVNGSLYPHKYQTFIERSLFDSAQRIIAKRSRNKI